MTNNHYNERLYLGLDSRPTEFNYTGVCNDLGKPVGQCACGHAIRYEYVVADSNGISRKLGSECIENYSFLSHIQKQIEEDKQQKLLLEKQSEDSELQTLLDERKALIDIAKKIKRDYDYQGQMTPFLIYEIAWKSRLKPIEKLKTTKAKIKNLKVIIARYKEILGVK
jgi:hypothetical protein